jgi:hypothetical protein
VEYLGPFNDEMASMLLPNALGFSRRACEDSFDKSGKQFSKFERS